MNKKDKETEKKPKQKAEAENPKEAREEGFEKIAFLFEKVAAIEKHHEERYKKLLENVEKGKVFKKEQKVVWECANCGFRYEGEGAIETCPVCSHPKSFFFVVEQKYD